MDDRRDSTSFSLAGFVSRYGDHLPLIVRMTVDQRRHNDVPVAWIHHTAAASRTSAAAVISPRVSHHLPYIGIR